MPGKLPKITAETIRRYLPVVLLVVWVALICMFRQTKENGIAETEASFKEVILLSGPQEKPRSIAYEAVVIADSLSASTPRDVLLYFAKDTARRYEAGDVVLIKARIEGERAYVPFGQSALIAHRRTAEIGWTEGKMRMLALRARGALEARLEQYIGGAEEVALAESLLLGDRRQLNADQRDAFSEAGAMHVLAVSGLHVGIIAGIAVWLLTLGGLLVIRWEHYRLRRLQRLLAVGLIWGYAFLTGMSVSVMRSALMFSVLPMANLRKQSSINYNRLAAAALIILVINPSAIGSPSFLLSFSAVLSIMYFVPRWQRRLPMWKATTWWQKKVQKAYGYVQDLVLMSVAAQIGTLPFTLLFFGQSSNYFLLTNVLVLPLAGLLLMPAGLAALASSFLPQEGLTVGLMRLTEMAAQWMNGSVRLVQSLPGAVSYFSFTPLMTVLLVVFIVAVSASLRLKGWGRYVALALAAVSTVGLLAAYWAATDPLLSP